MSIRLDGDVAVVTGAGKGIGTAIAYALAEAGARVIVTSRREEDAERVASGLGSGHMGIGMDVTSTAQVEDALARAISAIGVPTVLVNNAGINRLSPSESVTDTDWDDIVAANLSGVFRCCRTFGSAMLANGGGSIINLASVIGAEIGMPWRAPYGASKAGVVGLTRVLAVEWAPRSVRVNALLPGPTRTPMVAAAIENGLVDPQAVVDRSPMGRFAEPRDIASATLLLAAPESAFITGQVIAVDGGFSVYGAPHPAGRPFGPTPGDAA